MTPPSNRPTGSPTTREQLHDDKMIGKYDAAVIKRDFSAAIDKLSHELRQGLES